MTSNTTLPVAPSTMSTVSLYDYISNEEVTLPVDLKMKANDFARRFLAPWEKAFYNIEDSYASNIASSLKKLNIQRYKSTDSPPVYTYCVKDLLRVHKERYKGKYELLCNDNEYFKVLKKCSSFSDFAMHEGNHAEAFKTFICRKTPLVYIENLSWLDREAVNEWGVKIKWKHMIFRTDRKSNIIWDTEDYVPLGSFANISGIKRAILSLPEKSGILSTLDNYVKLTEAVQSTIRDSKFPVEIYYDGRMRWSDLTPYVHKTSVEAVKQVLLSELTKNSGEFREPPITEVQELVTLETPKEPLPDMQEMEEIKTFNILDFQISIKRKKKMKPTDFDIIEF